LTGTFEMTYSAQIMFSDSPNERAAIKLIVAIVMLLIMAGLCGCATPPPATPSADASAQGDRELRQGIHWYRKGCLRKAMNHVVAAHEQYCLADNQTGVARSLNSLANIYQQAGDVNGALRYYDAAVAAGKRSDDQSVAARALANKAAVLIEEGHLSAAGILLDKAQRLSPKTGPVFAIVLNHRAVMLIERKQYNDARKLLDRAASLADGDQSTTAATIHFTRGRLMTRTGKAVQAIGEFQQALAADRQAGFTRGMADDLFALAGIHEHLGENEAALNCLDRSLQLYALLEDHVKVAGSLDRLKALARKTGADLSVSIHFIEQWMTGGGIDAICR
jgi:tetratricopeptide (TPR) repeat protein